MTGDENKYQLIINKKCPYCYRKDVCMCLPSQRATLCLGPFKDDEDHSQKIKIYFQKEEVSKEDIERYMRKSKVDEYIEKRILFNYHSKDKGSDEGK